VLRIVLSEGIDRAQLRRLHRQDFSQAQELVGVMEAAGLTSLRPVFQLSESEVDLVSRELAATFDVDLAPGTDQANAALILRQSRLIEDVRAADEDREPVHVEDRLQASRSTGAATAAPGTGPRSPMPVHTSIPSLENRERSGCGCAPILFGVALMWYAVLWVPVYYALTGWPHPHDAVGMAAVLGLVALPGVFIGPGLLILANGHGLRLVFGIFATTAGLAAAIGVLVLADTAGFWGRAYAVAIFGSWGVLTGIGGTVWLVGGGARKARPRRTA
jgi:hypothetical protein